MIRFAQLQEALTDVGVSFPPALLQYLSLLFYSHSYELDAVPYRNFVRAYSEARDEEADEEKAKIVRQHLAKIAQRLTECRQRVRQTFKADGKGFVAPDQFMQGLKALGLDTLPQDEVVLMLEALQYEEDDDSMCIHVEELEEILEHYGVHKGPPTLNSLETDELLKHNSSEESSVIVKDSSDCWSNDSRRSRASI